MKLVRIAKILFSIFSFVILITYFDVIPNMLSYSKEYQYIAKAIWLAIFATSAYVLNYFRCVIRPRPSQKITPDRWYTIYPTTVWLIFLSYFLSYIYFTLSLWQRYRFISFVISTLGFSILFDILSN